MRVSQTILFELYSVNYDRSGMHSLLGQVLRGQWSLLRLSIQLRSLHKSDCLYKLHQQLLLSAKSALCALWHFDTELPTVQQCNYVHKMLK
jgi:hypothetical protein